MNAMNRGKDGSVIGYMCAINWQYELGAAMGGVIVYPSLEDLQRNHVCWEKCGVVEVKVFHNKTVVEESDFE